jgi:hypothetical protein
VSTTRTRELWIDRLSGDAFVVELERERVVAAEGPVDPEDLDPVQLVWTAPSEGRLPAFTELAADLDHRRGDFARRPLSAA